MASVYASGTTFRIDELKHAKSFWARFRGLMLRRELPAGSGLAIEPCGSIHMLFMRFPIDAVFYNREGEVTAVAHNVRPWLGMAKGRGKTRGVIELPAGAAVDLPVGSQLTFER